MFSQNPLYAAECFKRGLALFKEYNYNEAYTCFGDALAADPNHAEAHYYQGQILCKRNKFEDALISLNKACALAPHETDWGVEIANTYFQQANYLYYCQKDLDAALAAYDQALNSGSQVANLGGIYNNRGYICLLQKNYHEAISNLKLSIKTITASNRADNAIRYWNVGCAYHGVHKLDDALKYYIEALLIDLNDEKYLPHLKQALQLLATQKSDSLRKFKPDVIFKLIQKLPLQDQYDLFMLCRNPKTELGLYLLEEKGLLFWKTSTLCEIEKYMYKMNMLHSNAGVLQSFGQFKQEKDSIELTINGSKGLANDDYVAPKIPKKELSMDDFDELIEREAAPPLPQRKSNK